MRYDESGKLNVVKAAKLLLKRITPFKNYPSDAAFLAAMPKAQAARFKHQHSEMIKEFRTHAAAICAARGIPVPYIVDRTKDLDSQAVFEKALQHHIWALTGDAEATIEIDNIQEEYNSAVELFGYSGKILSRTDGQDWARWSRIVPARIMFDAQAFMVTGYPGVLRDQGDEANERRKWSINYHELGHILFPTAWTKQQWEYYRQGRLKECPDQPEHDAANGEMMADMTEMAFMTQRFGNTKAAKEQLANRLLAGLRGSAKPYWNAPRLAAFLPKLENAAKMDNAGIISLLEKEFETCLWTEKSFDENLEAQPANRWVIDIIIKKKKPPVKTVKATYAATPGHIHDCVEALCSLYKAEPAQMGICPIRPAVPALRPQM